METKDTLAQILEDAHLNVMHYDAKYPDAKERFKVEPDVAQKVDLIHRTTAVVREEFMENAYRGFANIVYPELLLKCPDLRRVWNYLEVVAQVLDLTVEPLMEKFKERYLAEYLEAHTGGGNNGE